MMAFSSRFSEVPIVNVNASNIKELWPSLALALKSSTFVALDTELSGLGNRKLLGARSLPDRYKHISDVAKTRSILSLGLSCFKLHSVGLTGADNTSCSPESQVQIRQWSYSVQTFNVLLLCSEDYMVEPAALKFLVEHGFDFNKQYTSGVSYWKGKEQTASNGTCSKPSAESGPTARQLFDLLLWSEVPLVVHNGLVDLVFLYHNFYTDLPSSLQVFLADLAEMFPHGIVDTKYLVEFVERLPATYLEYVFRKWQRKNALQRSVERREVCVDFGRLPVNTACVSFSQCGLPTACVETDFIPNTVLLHDLVCQCFAGHGWCSKGKQCSKSHAIDMILDLDGAKAAKKRKRRRRQRDMQQQQNGSKLNGNDENSLTKSQGVKRMRTEENSVTHSSSTHGSGSESVDPTSPQDIDAELDLSVEDAEDRESDSADYDTITESYLQSSQQLEKSRSGGHRAGFDAFMTGFTFACVLSKVTTLDDSKERVLGAAIKLRQLCGAEDLCNKIYTMGKDHPMTVGKSNFCQPSKNHRERIEKVKPKS